MRLAIACTLTCQKIIESIFHILRNMTDKIWKTYLEVRILFFWNKGPRRYWERDNLRPSRKAKKIFIKVTTSFSSQAETKRILILDPDVKIMVFKQRKWLPGASLPRYIFWKRPGPRRSNAIWYSSLWVRNYWCDPFKQFFFFFFFT